MNKKLLILDGISGISLARDITDTVRQLGVDAVYCNLAGLSNIKLYKPRSAIAKLLNKRQNKDSFFHLPKCGLAELEAVFVREQPDVILVIGFSYKFVAPLNLKRLAQKHNAQLFLYDTDSCNLYSNRREFIFFLDHELPVYDHIFSFSRVVTDFFVRQGLPASFAPFGSLELPHYQVQGEEHPVLFVGSGDLRRILLLESIADVLKVYGNRWQRNYPLMSEQLRQCVDDTSIWGDVLYQQLANSKIILNITRGPFYAAETGINLRIFEAMAAGCFVLTDYCDEVTELFLPGVEIETFKGSAELREKVEYYLSNDDARQQIAERGYQKFLSHYTWEQRMRQMLFSMECL